MQSAHRLARDCSWTSTRPTSTLPSSTPRSSGPSLSTATGRPRRWTSSGHLFRAPLVRALLGIRALPRGVVRTLRVRRSTASAPEAPPRTFRLEDLVGLGWILLGETPGVEVVLGQVSRPWKAVADPTDGPPTPEEFTGFDEPGYAKIVAGLRVDP